MIPKIDCCCKQSWQVIQSGRPYLGTSKNCKRYLKNHDIFLSHSAVIYSKLCFFCFLFCLAFRVRNRLAINELPNWKATHPATECGGLVVTPTMLRMVENGLAEWFSTISGTSWDWVRPAGFLPFRVDPDLWEARVEAEWVDRRWLIWRLKGAPGIGTGAGSVSPKMQPQGSKIISSTPMDSNQPRKVEELLMVWVPMPQT